MSPSREKYLRIPDLYTQGHEFRFKNGTVAWMQRINSFEREEALRDAQVARARFVLAMGNPESDELARIRGMFLANGREDAITLLLETKQGDALMEVIDELRVDPDWADRRDVVLRGSDLASVASSQELQAVEQAELEYAEEVQRRTVRIVDVEREALTSCSEDELWDQYKSWWLDRYGFERGNLEYRLTEAWYSARACEGIESDGGWDHSSCDGHQIRIFATKDDIKALPEEMQDLLRDELGKLDLLEREVKNLDRAASSYVESRPPVEPVDSVPTTSTETSNQPPGPLPALSPTP